MYEAFYNFREKPFNLTPDPKFLYFSKQHQGALDHMLYGIREREGFIVIVGGIGTGKTTLCRCLLNKLDANIQVALILNPMLSGVDLLRTLVHDLGVRRLRPRVPVSARRIDDDDTASEKEVPEPSPAPAEDDSSWVDRASKKELLDALNQFLLSQHARGGSTVVIIDEAQNLAMEVMEQVRLLSNLETEKEKLLQIIFVGHRELDEKLKLPELKQLRQRISIQYELKPLSREETRHYIDHRILVACGTSRVEFTRGALSEIYNYSRGYPRLINLVCDRALLAGYNAQTDLIEARHVKQGIRSLLGEEQRDFFLKRFFTERLPLALSILFFLAGLVFFALGGQGGWPRLMQWIESQQAPAVSLETADAPEVPPPVPVPEAPEPESAEAAGTPELPGGAPEANAAGTVQAPEKPPVSVLAPDLDRGFYRIQVHSSRKKSEAEKFLQELKKEGYETFMKAVRSTGKVWYVVYIGPYRQLEQARRHLNALKSSGRNPILLSINPQG